jgi:flagellar basal-body rod protein FlgB
MSGTIGAGDFFGLAERKLEWLGQRNAVIAGNIANSNTPGYAARDIAPFAATLAGTTVGMAHTDEGADLGATTGAADTTAGTEPERSPDKNGVSLDHELTLLAQTQDQQGEVTTLYKRYTSMVQTALGMGGSG